MTPEETPTAEMFETQIDEVSPQSVDETATSIAVAEDTIALTEIVPEVPEDLEQPLPTKDWLKMSSRWLATSPAMCLTPSLTLDIFLKEVSERYTAKFPETENGRIIAEVLASLEKLNIDETDPSQLDAIIGKTKEVKKTVNANVKEQNKKDPEQKKLEQKNKRQEKQMAANLFRHTNIVVYVRLEDGSIRQITIKQLATIGKLRQLLAEELGRTKRQKYIFKNSGGLVISGSDCCGVQVEYQPTFNARCLIQTLGKRKKGAPRLCHLSWTRF